MNAMHSPSPRAAVPPPFQPHAEQAIQVVLSMLREQTGMDVVFVREFHDGDRRFRMVEALSHGPAAALATAKAPAPDMGVLLQSAVILRDGRVLGQLCGHAPQQEAALLQQRRRALQHGARLAARLLDNEEVLRELSRLAI